MNFIKLTDSELKTPVYVKIETICVIYPYNDRCTVVTLNNSRSYFVSEKPKKVLEMIENILHESNKK